MKDATEGNANLKSMDNFFTSWKLGRELFAKKTAIPGTVNKKKRELPDLINQKHACWSRSIFLWRWKSKPLDDLSV